MLCRPSHTTRRAPHTAHHTRDAASVLPQMLKGHTPSSGAQEQREGADAQEDELVALDRSLQQAAVAATIDRLHRRLPALEEQRQPRTLTVACLEGDAINQAAAVVVAAAMQPADLARETGAIDATHEQRLAAANAADAVLQASAAARTNAAAWSMESHQVKGQAKGTSASADGEGGGGGGGQGGGGASSGRGAAYSAEEGGAGGAGGGEERATRLLLGECQADVSSLLRVLALLDAIFSRASGDLFSRFHGTGPAAAGGRDVPATTKLVQNLIERHVGPGDSLLLFTSCDIKLEARLLSQLQAQRSTIHAHINDDTMVCPPAGFYFA